MDAVASNPPSLLRVRTACLRDVVRWRWYTRTRQVDDEFMFGDFYLVAPVLAAGLVSRDVYLPTGSNWTHVFTGVNYTGGRNYSVPAPLDSFPLFTRD